MTLPSEGITSLTEEQFKNLKANENLNTLANKLQALIPVAVGVKKPTATENGTAVVSDTNINAGDIPFVTLIDDDGETPVGVIEATCTANTLTITFTTDGDSDHEALFAYQIFRPYP
jgi:hypothetical protein